MHTSANMQASTLIDKPSLVRAYNRSMPIFSSWLLTVSIEGRYHLRSHHSSKVFCLCMLALRTATNLMSPSANRASSVGALMYALSPYTLAPSGRSKVSSWIGTRSCQPPGSIWKATGKPSLVHIRCNLHPKNFSFLAAHQPKYALDNEGTTMSEQRADQFYQVLQPPSQRVQASTEAGYTDGLGEVAHASHHTQSSFMVVLEVH